MAKKIATTTEQYTVNKRYDNSNGSKVYATCMDNKRLPSVLLSSDEVGMDNLPQEGEGFVLQHSGKSLVNTTAGKHLIVDNPKVIDRAALTAVRASAPVAFDEAAYLAELDQANAAQDDEEVPFD
jgi:hypothetical protein